MAAKIYSMELITEIRDDDIGFEKEEVSDWRKRDAARCILNRGDKIALLNVSKYGYHKLPGGGIEDGEDVEEALRREVREEVGSEIQIEKELGKIVEYKSLQSTKQESVCFLVTEEKHGNPSHTEKEIEEGYQVDWYTLEKAIGKLVEEKPSHYVARFITTRDLRFLQEAEEQL